MTEEEKKTLSDLFEAMGKTGAQFQIGQVIGSQANTYNYYGERMEKGEEVDWDEETEPLPLVPSEHNEELCHFIHPSVDSAQEWQVHDEVKRLVTRQGIQEICVYLKQMADAHRILLPQSPGAAYTELVRMGMPNGEGFNEKTFQKYYKR